MLLIINSDAHLLYFLIENWIIILINYDYDYFGVKVMYSITFGTQAHC